MHYKSAAVNKMIWAYRVYLHLSVEYNTHGNVSDFREMPSSFGFFSPPVDSFMLQYCCFVLGKNKK